MKLGGAAIDNMDVELTAPAWNPVAGMWDRNCALDPAVDDLVAAAVDPVDADRPLTDSAVDYCAAAAVDQPPAIGAPAEDRTDILIDHMT